MLASCGSKLFIASSWMDARKEVIWNSGLVRGKEKVAGRGRGERQAKTVTSGLTSAGGYLYSVAKEDLELWKMNLITT